MQNPRDVMCTECRGYCLQRCAVSDPYLRIKLDALAFVLSAEDAVSIGMAKPPKGRWQMVPMGLLATEGLPRWWA